MNKIVIYVFSFFVCIGFAEAQGNKGKECLDYIRALEDSMVVKNKTNSVSYLSYESTAIDWDGLVVNAKVRMYRDSTHLHFFSDKADIYQDSKDLLVAVYLQRIVLWNKSAKAAPQDANLTKELANYKNLFFDACEVVKCQATDNEDIWVLELKAPKEPTGVLFIDKIYYTYNKKLNRILTSTTKFYKGYKLREMKIEYKEFQNSVKYNFGSSARSWVLNKKDRPAGKYKGFELIDNR